MIKSKPRKIRKKNKNDRFFMFFLICTPEQGIRRAFSAKVISYELKEEILRILTIFLKQL
jgi:hypothetical protein